MGFLFNTLESDYSREYITVRSATEISGYNQQYLRRLLRGSTFRSKRIGQLWLIEREHFIEFMNRAYYSKDKRHGPQSKVKKKLIAKINIRIQKNKQNITIYPQKLQLRFLFLIKVTFRENDMIPEKFEHYPEK